MRLLPSFELEMLEARVLLSDVAGVAPAADAENAEGSVEVAEEANAFAEPQSFQADNLFGDTGQLEEISAAAEDASAHPSTAAEQDAESREAVIAGLNPNFGPPDRPLLLLHGIGGSWPSHEDADDWLMERGFHPAQLIVDPITDSFDELTQSLVNTGYTLHTGQTPGANLFVANYDWRMTPGPTDGSSDGRIHKADGSSLDAAEITDAEYEHGVDYLGYWLAQAALTWAAQPGNGDRLPEGVDIVAHSTGGLVARVYIQSDAYGGSAPITAGQLANGLIVPAGTRAPDGTLLTDSLPLPKVHDMITMGVPMRGAPGPFLLWQDDWGMHESYVYLGKVMAAAYEKYFEGETIAGPGSTDIAGYVAGVPQLSPRQFIEQYCPTIQSLIATFPFIYTTPGHSQLASFSEGGALVGFNDTRMANGLVLDLNDGLDDLYTPEQLNVQDWSYTEESGKVHLPLFFIGEMTGTLTVVYSDSLDTMSALTKRLRPPTEAEKGRFDYNVTPFCDWTPRTTGIGETWYVSNLAEGSPGHGDESVPVQSSLGLYRDPENPLVIAPLANLEIVHLNPAGGEVYSHVGMLSTRQGIMAVLTALDRGDEQFVEEGEQAGLSSAGATMLYSYIDYRDYLCHPHAAQAGLRQQAAPGANEVVALTTAELAAIADGIQALKAATLAGIRGATEVLEAEIALLERAIGVSGEIILESVLGAAESTFDLASAALLALPDGTRADEMIEVMFDIGIIAAGSFTRVSEEVFQFTIDFTSSVASTAAIVLGEQATELGIALSSAVELAITDYFRIVATVTVDLAAAADAVFGVTNYRASQGVYSYGTDLEGTVTMGSNGDSSYAGGEAQVHAYAWQQFRDDSGDNRLTTAELRTTPTDSLASVTGRGEARAVLPTETGDEKIVYAKSSEPVGTEADIVVGSINFEAIKDRLREILEALAAIGDAMEDPAVQTALHVPLPFLDDPNNNTLDELLTDDQYGLGLDEFFNLVDVLLEYCETAGEPNLAGLVDHFIEALRLRLGDEVEGELAHGPISIRGGFDVDSDAFELVFEIAMEKQIAAAITAEGLGAEADALGLDLNVPVTATLGFESEFVLSMDLSQFLFNPAAGISKNSVSLTVNRVRSTFDLEAPDIDATVTLGFIEAGIIDGSASLNTAFDVLINGGNPLTLAQSATVLPSSLVAFSPAPTSALNIELPLVASINGAPVDDDGCEPVIIITDTNLFDSAPPAVTTQDFDCLTDFLNLSPAQVLVMLKGLADWLEQFRGSPVFSLTVPFSSGTTFGDLFDFSAGFIDTVYDAVIVYEIVGNGPQTDAVVNLGQIVADASFTLQLDDGAPVSVTLAAIDTAANTSLEDLAANLNLSLALAGLGASVEAAVTSNRRIALRLKRDSGASKLTLNVPDADGNSATPNTDAMVAEIGFGQMQFSIETPSFNGIDELGDLISEALAVNGIPLDVMLTWNEGTSEIRMLISFTQTYSWQSEFEFDPDLGLGPLAEASAGGTFNFTASAHAEFTLGFDLNAEVAPTIRTNPLIPPPSSGVLTDDANFTLKLDNERYDITIPRDASNTSLADLAADINAQFAAEGISGKVEASLSGNAIVLTVAEAQLGTIHSIQILGADNGDPAFTELGFINGDSDRSDVKGLFVENVVLEGSADLAATDLDAAFRFGVFAIIAEDGAAVGEFGVSVALEGANGDRKFHLQELKDAAPDFGSVLTVEPELTGSIEITAPTITVEPELVELPAGEPFRIYIPDIKNTQYNSSPYDPVSNNEGLFITFPTIGGLNNFNCLTVLNIIQSLDTIVDQLEEMQVAGFLGQPIPLINVSIGDILDVAGNFAEFLEGLATANPDTIETLEADLEEFFQVSDPNLITLSIDDYSPAAFSGGGPNAKVASTFNPSGVENAVIFRARANGVQYRDVNIEFVDDGRYTGVTNDAEAEYDAENRVLRIYYHSGFTTAAEVVATLAADLALPFEALLDTVAEAGDGSGTVSLTALKFSLHYNLAYGEYLPLDVDLQDLINMLPAGDPARTALGALGSLVQIEGSAELNITASADFLLEFGIDVSNPCGPVPFLYDSTSATLNAAVRGSDIDLTISVGPLGVFVRDGTVTVDRDGDPDTTGAGEDAVFAITINDPDGDGRHYFRDGLGFVSDLQVTLEAGASAELPLFFPVETLPVGSNRDDNNDGHPDNELVIEIPRLSDLFDLQGNPVSITTPDLQSLLTDFNVCDLVTNASVLLDGLDALLGMIQDGLQSEVLNRNLPLIGKELAKAGDFIQDFREGLLAEIRLKLAAAGDPIALVQQAFWNALGKPGLDILVDADGTDVESAEDIDIFCEQRDGEVMLLFNIVLEKSIALVDTTANPLRFDIGVPGFGLEVDANVVVEIGFTLNLFFGISTQDGFFFDTDGLTDLASDDTELTVFFEVTVPGLSATGELFFLQVEVADETDGDGDARAPSHFSGHFLVDVFDSSGRLTFSEIVGGGFNPGRTFGVTLEAEAEIHLNIDVSFGEDARLPRLTAEFDLTWRWEPPGDGGNNEGAFGELEFGFHNVNLDLGSFISKFLIPILKDIKTVVEPAKPLIDLLTMRLPIFSDLASEPMTLVDLGERAGLISPTTRDFIEAVDVIFELVDDTRVGPGDEILVNVGGFDLEADEYGNITSSGVLDEDPIDVTTNETDEDARGFLEDLEAIGFTFPFLKISEIFKLITGGDVAFVEYRMPLLEFDAKIDFKIPIFLPLYIIFGGGIGATIDLTFGYDTAGLKKFANNPDKKISDLAEGFYVKDVDDYGKEISEITLSGGLFAGASLDILVAEAGVTGGIYADVMFDLRDNDEDGRVRISEILANAKEGPLCVFDVMGRIYVSLDAFLEVHLLILDVEKEWNFGEITLLEFGLDCPQPVLASYDGDEEDGDLILHMGEFAGMREHGDTADGDERFTVRPLTSLENGAQDVEVSFGGITQTYRGVKTLLVKAGKGNDTIDLTGINVDVTVYGGDGDDVIKAGRGGGVYYGDNGNDTITAEQASSDFAGRADEFHGGAGNDTLTSYEGDDELFGDDGEDVLNGGLDNDTLDGGDGNDELFGEDGDDVLTGRAGVDLLDGEEGVDILTGGSGDDTLYGRGGNDQMFGNAGNDFLDGGTGDDVLLGDDGIIVNPLEITGVSGDGEDTLAGGPGSDVLIGAGGDDALYGGTHVTSGRTTAVAVVYRNVLGTLAPEPDGADFLDGGEGNDVLFADDAHSGMATSFAGAELGDRVWLDLDEDGVQDTNEPGLSGVVVELYLSGEATAKARTTTNASGDFRFTGLAGGDYFLKITAPEGTLFTIDAAGEADTDSDVSDPDLDGVGESEVFHLDVGATDLTHDAGIKGTRPTISIGDASVIEGDSGIVYLTFVVSLSSAASQVVTVCYKTILDSDASTTNAAPGADFVETDYTLVFEPGVTSLEVMVAVNGDLKDEPNEVFLVQLADAFLYIEELDIADDTGVGTIIDDDDSPTVSISDSSVVELDGANNAEMIFTVTLSNPSSQALTFDWRILQKTNSDGSPAYDTATINVDYVDESGALVFAEDVTTLTLNVTVKGDVLDEYDEEFLVRLVRNDATPLSAASIVDDTAIGVILDDNLLTPETGDDDLSPFVSVRVLDPTPVAEGHAGNKIVSLELTLGRASGREVIVNWNTNRGTALDTATLTESADFAYKFETTTFAPGETAKTINVEIIGDTVVESEEYFFVNLLSAVNGRIGVNDAQPNHAVVSIADDESGDPGPWYVQFSDANYSVIEGGLATITLVRAGNSSFPLAVYWVADGTAKAGIDYDPALNIAEGGQHGFVRFGPGETTKTFTIQTYDNRFLGLPVYEQDETILLSLANPTGGAVRGAIANATLTIVDDDPLPVITISDASSTGHFAAENGSLSFQVQVSGASEVDVQVRYSSISGTAIAEDDFITKNDILTFSASDLNAPQTIVIDLKDDTEVEAIEDLFVVLFEPLNAVIGDDPEDNDSTGGEDSDDRGYGIILDDDEGMISGTVFFDSNGNGFLDSAADYGFAGVKVVFTNSLDGAEYEGTTGATGSYSVALPLGDYTVEIDDSLLPEGAEPASFVLPLALSLLEDSAVLDFGYSIPATVEQVAGSSGSGTAGNNDTVYGGAGNDVIDGGAGDDWLVGGHWLGPGCACEGLGYDIHLDDSNGTRSRLFVDPASLPEPATIRGRVWVDTNNDETELAASGNEAGLQGVQVNLYDSTWTLVATTYTNETGNYIFGNLSACDYVVQVLAPGGYAFTREGVGASDHNSDVDPLLGLTDEITVAAGETKFHIDAGIEALAAGSEPLNVSFSHSIYVTRESELGALITLLGDGASAYPVAVYYTRDGTATLDIDYTSARGTVRFGFGETSKLFLVPVILDDVEEGHETVLLTLQSPTGGQVNGAQQFATLLIFDEPCPDDDTISGQDGNDVLLGDFGYFEEDGGVVLLGGMGNDTLSGDEGDDTLYGEGGNDTLEGGVGDDLLNGGSENDTYVFDTDFILGTDDIEEEITPFGGSDTLDFSTTGLSLEFDLANTSAEVRDGATLVLALNFPAERIENVIAGAGNDILRGNDQNNILDGGSGDDALEGRGGDDDLTGGDGSDLYVFDADNNLGHDDIFEASSRDTDTIDFGDTTGQAVSLDLSLTTSQTVAPTLTLTLNTAAPDTKIVTVGGMVLIAHIRTDLFAGTAVSTGIENLFGSRYSPGSGVQDNLAGNSRDNVIWGREGNDHLDGGSSGYDVLREERAGNWNLSSGTLSNVSTGETDTFVDLTFDEIALIGDDNANILDASSFSGTVRLEGRGGADTLIGGSGTNYLSGGEGVDVIDGSRGIDVITEERDATMVLTSGTLMIGAEFETFVGIIEQAHLIGGASPNELDARGFGAPVTLEGRHGDDLLYGSVAGDILIGGGGNDDLFGGAGDDIYQFDADEPLGADELHETVNEGVDTIDLSLTDAMGASVALNMIAEQMVNENLAISLSHPVTFENLSGTQQDDVLSGNAASNEIWGNNGNDRISGGFGSDLLHGGDGTNAAGADFEDSLVETRDADMAITGTGLHFNGSAEDTHDGFERAELAGGAGNNSIDASLFKGAVTLDGGAGNDTLIGSAYDDTFIASAGEDSSTGGLGNDLYLFDADNALGSEIISDTGGVEWLDFSATSTLQIEVALGVLTPQPVNANLNLTLSDASFENLRGGSLDDTLTGNASDNIIEGLAGEDLITGRAGDDLLIGGGGSDTYRFVVTATIALGSDIVLEDVRADARDTIDFSGSTVALSLNLDVGHSQALHTNLHLAFIRCHSIENVIGGVAAHFDSEPHPWRIS